MNSGERFALFSDLYEFTMGGAYLAEDADTSATFELWVRSLPDHRNFLVVAGMERALAYLERLEFDDGDIEYLRGLDMFDERYLERLANLRFTGDCWAMPEGTVAFGGEPFLRVTAPRIEAQLVETFLLSAITFETAIASKAARVTHACGDRPYAEFGGRRAHGIEAAIRVARAAYIAGAASTSNVEAGRRYGIPVSGTMAHSFVLSFPDELTAFRAYSRHYADTSTLLIDTYDIVEGARNAVTVGKEMEEAGARLQAVRLDSGDVAGDAKKVRTILDDAGLDYVRIFVSGDLDEYAIARLDEQGAPVDAFGVGTHLATSSDAPSLGGIYKLVEDVSGGRAKYSEGKRTLPYAKQVYRRSHEDMFTGDLLALASETGVEGKPLLQQVIRGGKRIIAEEPLETVRERCATQVASLPPRLRRLEDTDERYPVEPTPRLEAEARRLAGGR